ncbi:NAD-dependent epimerase/dehydratase family protein [Acidihalobacter prosperus]
MRIVVTGSSGRLGRVLIPCLLATDQAHEIIGIDTQPAPFTAPRYQHHRLDIRHKAIQSRFVGADAVVHLAFVLMGGNLGRRRNDRQLIHDINMQGSQRVFKAAADAGLRQAVFVSSAAVYGAWPDNPPRLTEQAPLRPMPGFAYAQDKIAVEHWLEHFAADHPDLTVTRMRPHAIVGAHAHPLLNAVLKQPVYPFVSPAALTQCIWEDDVARAIRIALERRIPGVFNLAADPPMSLRDMLGLTQRLRIPLPISMLGWLHRIAWQLTPLAGEPGWIQGLRYSLALDTRKASQLLGFKPAYDVPQCIRHASNGWQIKPETPQ